MSKIAQNSYGSVSYNSGGKGRKYTSARVSIPNAWLYDMGMTADDDYIVKCYDTTTKTITIKKDPDGGNRI